MKNDASFVASFPILWLTSSKLLMKQYSISFLKWDLWLYREQGFIQLECHLKISWLSFHAFRFFGSEPKPNRNMCIHQFLWKYYFSRRSFCDTIIYTKSKSKMGSTFCYSFFPFPVSCEWIIIVGERTVHDVKIISILRRVQICEVYTPNWNLRWIYNFCIFCNFGIIISIRWESMWE